MPAQRSRPPADEPESGKTIAQQQTDKTSVRPPHADTYGVTREQAQLLHNWIADANDVAADRLALVAVVETPKGDYRRRVFLSLHAAHRALERAGERGLEARVVLCELRPVGGAE